MSSNTDTNQQTISSDNNDNSENENNLTPPLHTIHAPVLLTEVLDYLHPNPTDTIVDATLGLAGHATALADKLNASGRLIGIDRDATALQLATERLTSQKLACQFSTYHGTFDQIAAALAAADCTKADCILMDLGVSSLQLDSAERGFSFRHDVPLDMRMDSSSQLTAADIIGNWTESELSKILWDYGEEKKARRLAKRIVEERQVRPITTTGQLATLAQTVIGYCGRIHSATRTFQALRIAVNDELQILSASLEALPGIVNPGGRVAIISFHSLEDRIVKLCFRQWKQAGRVTVLTKKPLVATETERAENPRSRSAKLRVCQFN